MLPSHASLARSAAADISPTPNHVPLCVDLDGTLIKTDLLIESWLALLKCAPLQALAGGASWLWRGKACLKTELAARVSINAAQLPYHRALLSYLKEQHNAGRRLVLATASATPYAKAIAEHLGIFSEVVASTPDKNLSGIEKCRALVDRFGVRGFDYIGNESADLKIFAQARAALLVAPARGVEREARRLATVEAVFPAEASGVRRYLRAIRVHQWLKNLLIFIPLFAAHAYADIQLIGAAVIAFIAFSVTASGVYLANDMLDLPADRAHPRKRTRAFAAGDISLQAGMALMGLLFLAGFGLSLLLPSAFLPTLAGYLAVTFAYSFWLKGKVLADVFVLAGLYTMRLLAGSAAVGIAPSFWLLAFSMFLFLSLAMVKRYTELAERRRAGSLMAAGRGYTVADLSTVQSLGAAGGYISVLVLALYIYSTDVRVHYRHEQVLWFVCPLLLYWISRMWQRAGREEMHDDPLVYAMKDRVSLLVIALIALVILAAV